MSIINHDWLYMTTLPRFKFLVEPETKLDRFGSTHWCSDNNKAYFEEM